MVWKGSCGGSSIGTDLTLDPPVTMWPFEARIIEQYMKRLSPQYGDELTEHVNLMENAIEKVSFPDNCHGFSMDGDMTTRLEAHPTLHGTWKRFTSAPSCVCGSNWRGFQAGNVPNRLVQTLWSPSVNMHPPSRVSNPSATWHSGQ